MSEEAILIKVIIIDGMLLLTTTIFGTVVLIGTFTRTLKSILNDDKD